ncbi:MAG: transcription antitermination factor NusB [Deltaproteobacteria bacterium]|nr:transcription antitermination factor NusB [Deltaproteobacteria bacterium]
MGARRKGRELAVQALYQFELSGELSKQALDLFWSQSEAGERAKQFAAELIDGTRKDRARIDELIAGATQHWRMERLAAVDLCVLRVATHELLSSEKPPTSVILDEAIEIARRFGTQESRGFVNGVLDAIAEKLGVKDKEGARE